MRSTLVVILLWGLLTVFLCIVGLTLTAAAVHRAESREHDPIHSLMRLLAVDMDRVFQTEGKEGLAAHSQHLDEQLPGRRHLVDADNRDILTGADLTAIVESTGEKSVSINRLSNGQLAAVVAIEERPRRFIWIVNDWFGPMNPMPFIAVVVTILALMATMLAVYLSLPLHRLRLVMERFGSGDLGARVQTKRLDEIGSVSREFDLLAERVEKLVTAERRLLQDVSHELRSPLTRLEVAIDLAIQRPDSGAMLHRIRRDITRISALVSELLQLTRAEADPREPFVLEELLQRIVEDCQIEADTKDGRLELHSTWRGKVNGNPELLRRAFENVIRNAIRYSPTRAAVTVSLTIADTIAQVEVCDVGPGVPDEALSEIFHPFYRVQDDRSRETGGVGLGLSIARRAIEVHHGAISARNRSPGLCISIMLPAEQVSSGNARR